MQITAMLCPGVPLIPTPQRSPRRFAETLCKTRHPIPGYSRPSGSSHLSGALTPNTFWVDLKQVDFSHETGKVMKLDLSANQRNVFSGNTFKDFKPSEPFHFLGLPGA